LGLEFGETWIVDVLDVGQPMQVTTDDIELLVGPKLRDEAVSPEPTAVPRYRTLSRGPA
jgi:hypothetical protein